MKRSSWLEKAKCTSPDYSTEMFFSTENKRMRRRQADRALSIWEQCNVVDECAQDLVNGSNFNRDVYPYHVRAGRRLWVKEEVLTLPLPEAS